MKKVAVALREKGSGIEHFGKSEYFAVYNYDDEALDMEIENIVFSIKDADSTDEQWEKSADAINDCDFVICEQIGLPAKAGLEERNIKVVEKTGSIELALNNFLREERKKKEVVLP